MASRDGCRRPIPAHPANRRYLEGQRRYLRECPPRERADVVVDVTDVTAPVVLRPRPGDFLDPQLFLDPRLFLDRRRGGEGEGDGQAFGGREGRDPLRQCAGGDEGPEVSGVARVARSRRQGDGGGRRRALGEVHVEPRRGQMGRRQRDLDRTTQPVGEIPGREWHRRDAVRPRRHPHRRPDGLDVPPPEPVGVGPPQQRGGTGPVVVRDEVRQAADQGRGGVRRACP